MGSEHRPTPTYHTAPEPLIRCARDRPGCIIPHDIDHIEALIRLVFVDVRRIDFKPRCEVRVFRHVHVPIFRDVGRLRRFSLWKIDVPGESGVGAFSIHHNTRGPCHPERMTADRER